MGAAPQASSLKSPYEFFVFANRLRPGDVILTLGNEKSSKQIAATTESQFSHAILVVTPHRWFEADDAGVGFSSLSLCGGQIEGEGVFGSVAGLADCAGATVFRHPALSEVESERLQALLEEIVAPLNGLDYSDYRRLEGPRQVTGRWRWPALAALWWLQWKEKRSAAGMFCSEVVAKVYCELAKEERLGEQAALFSAYRDPALVHPGHLSKSRLQPVLGAAGAVAELPSHLRIRWSLSTTEDRRLPAHVHRTLMEISEMRRDFDETHRQQVEAHARELQKQCARAEHQLRERQASYAALGLAHSAERVAELLTDFARANTQQQDMSWESLGNIDLLRGQLLIQAHEVDHDAFEELIWRDAPDAQTLQAMYAMLEDSREKLAGLRESWKAARQQWLDRMSERP